jgi:hypothetical protein
MDAGFDPDAAFELSDAAERQAIKFGYKPEDVLNWVPATPKNPF